jgi:hypothetical protein
MLSTVVGGLALLMGLCLMPHVGRAQQPDTSEQTLPEIAPQEFEIRGELQLSFPSLERQPLRGFASPPSVPSVPADRTPYVEPYKQALEDLPESLPAPDASPQTVQQPAEAQQGFVEAGGGRYASRFAAGRVAFDVSAAQTLSLHADYTGTEGFSPFAAASGLDTPADAVEGGLQFDSRHDGFSVRATAQGHAQQYTLYGQPGAVTGPDPEAPTRTGAGGEVQARLRTHGPIQSQIGLGYTRSSYTTEPDAAAPSVSFGEGQLALDGRVSFPIAGATTYAELDVTRSAYTGDLPSDPTGYSVSGGAGTRVWAQERLSVKAGVRVLTFSAPRAPSTASTATADGTYILPSARAELALATGVTAFAENTPTLQSARLDELYGTNPYAEHAPSLRPTVYTTNAAAGLSAALGPVRLQAEGGYRYAPTYRFFTSPSSASGGLADAPLQVGYGSARILRGAGQLALQGVEGVEASVEAVVRDGQLVGADASLPYFSPVVVRAMASVSFLDGRALLQTSGTVESPRPIRPGADREVGTYTSFSVEGSYEVTSLLDALLRIDTLSPDAPTRWARYPRPPTAVQAGLRIRW